MILCCANIPLYLFASLWMYFKVIYCFGVYFQYFAITNNAIMNFLAHCLLVHVNKSFSRNGIAGSENKRIFC